MANAEADLALDGATDSVIADVGPNSMGPVGSTKAGKNG